jgi:hypothetical protein
MKRALVVIVLAMVAAAFFWNVNGSSLSRQREAMQKVLGDRMVARKFCVVTVSNETRMQIEQYTQALDKIDAKLCPKEFAMAWMDYVHAWDMICEGCKPDRVVYDTGMKADAVRRLNEADTTEAFYKCQRIAATYGVGVPGR